MTKIIDLSLIYRYRTSRTSWENDGRYNVHCLAYQLSGHYDHTFPDGALAVKADTVLLIRKRTPYAVKCLEQGEAICVTFSGETDLKTLAFDCKEHPEIKNLFTRLLRFQNLRSPVQYCEAASIVYRICSFLHQKSAPEYVAGGSRVKIQNAFRFLTEHYTDPSLKTAELAKTYGMSPKYFRTLFKSVYHTTPSQYVISLRLQNAVKLLTESRLSVGAVSGLCGFSDAYYFSKLFKSRFSCAPNAYRKRRSE